MPHSPEKPAGFSLASIGLRLSAWFEHWFPDAFALALAACAIVFLASLAAGASPADAAQWFGAGFWDLVAFTMQIALIIVTGYVVAVSPPVYAVIRRIATVPAERTRRRGVRGTVLDAVVAAVVEFQPDFQRPAGARGRAPGQGHRLPRARRRRVPRHRQRLGARPVIVRRTDHGVAGVAAGLDRGDQRRHPARTDAWPVAEPADGGSGDRAVDDHLLLLGAVRRSGARHGADGRDLHAAPAAAGQAGPARRMARVQPLSHAARLRTGDRVLRRARSQPSAPR